ncbi:glycosyl hydrolase family 95 catalytic domain-containing protein [Catenulispora pinisilvae]|uniref:glycosyl hydrolase family 95 catalytic domain-containing protein n=1 Tax=Catenulispora pinisilvae TaxID=2705253 RepID=UPI001891707D|nr:glycoside hydrolase N-terminal domain-containing protein [Catenulispora pinisilvae]
MTAHDLLLAWPRPADSWFQAAPVGNGRLAAMVFGGLRRGRWQINDSTVWSGTPAGPAAGLADVLGAGAGPGRLGEVRAAIRAGEYRRAESLLMSFEGRYSQEYLPFVDLWMSLDGTGDYQSRTLNLDTGVVTEAIGLDGRRIQRRTWASRPAGAICIALDVDDGTLDVGLELTSELRVVQRTGLSLAVELPIDGAPTHEPTAEPHRYSDGPVAGYDPYGVAAMAIDTDGVVRVADGAVHVTGASRLLIVLTSSTGGADSWSGTVPTSRDGHLHRATTTAQAALEYGSDLLLREHEADLRRLLGGTELTVGARRAGTFDVAEDVLSGKDEQLTATVLVQLGRYLLAAASRPGGGPPPTLQGIWNQELSPPWSSNYTLNINTEMNYWGVETAGLGECHDPLFRLIERLAETGTPVARQLYGARGWLAHHNTDMWGWALPVGMGHGSPSWAIWMMGGVWLTQHLWDHFEFQQDLEFLRDRAWPLMRGCAEFCLDWLVVGDGGFLDTVPSTSPENLFLSLTGSTESLTVSSAMDVALIRALFTRCLAAAELLAIDDPVCAEIAAALPRLRPPGLTADGRLLEWGEDHVEQDPHHRHVSHLVGLYPLDQIDPDRTPALAEAARASLDRRGPGAMGWSWSWKIALRARLGDGATARDLLLEATRPFARDPLQSAPPEGTEWGGLLPNLFSTHPPFQMDGNFGLMAAVVEMLVQSHGGTIRVLPALPEQWPDGMVRGIRCRGGLAVDLAWRAGRLSALTVRRLHGEDRPVCIDYRGRRTEIRVAAGSSAEVWGLASVS